VCDFGVEPVFPALCFLVFGWIWVVDRLCVTTELCVGVSDFEMGISMLVVARVPCSGQWSEFPVSFGLADCIGGFGVPCVGQVLCVFYNSWLVVFGLDVSHVLLDDRLLGY
jgi:hypothetical protein